MVVVITLIGGIAEVDGVLSPICGVRRQDALVAAQVIGQEVIVHLQVDLDELWRLLVAELAGAVVLGASVLVQVLLCEH